MIAWRTPDGAASAATSGLALGVGYTAAGLGPLLMGVLIDVTGGFAAAIALLLLAGPGAGVRDPRGSATADHLRTSVRVQRRVERDAVARAGQDLTAPVTELRRNNIPSCPDRVGRT